MPHIAALLIAAEPRGRTKPASKLDPRNRRFWRTLHLWLGISVGLFWAIAGFTGSLLVFHRELDRIGAPALTEGSMISPGRLIAQAEAVAGAPILRLTRVSADPRLIEARYVGQDGRTLALEMDAATGRVVGRRERDPATPFTGSGWRWIYLVHMSMMAGMPGRTAMGASALVLSVTLCVGLGLAWPRRRHWRSAFAHSQWRTLLQRLWGWHRAIGMFAAVPLTAMALTGAYMTFETSLAPMLARILPFQPLAALGHGMTREAGADARVKKATPAGISPDKAWSIARAYFPSGHFMNLEMPNEHPGYYSIRFTLPSEWRRWAGRAMVQIDPSTSEVLGVYDPRSAGIVNAIDDAAYPFHIGELGGLPGRLAVAVLGLTLPLFYVTGLWLWVRKRRMRAASKANQRPGIVVRTVL